MGTTKDEDRFTEEDEAVFRGWERQADLAEPVIKRNYAESAGKDGAWVAFRDGKLVANADTADRLAKELDRRGIQRDDVMIRYLLGKDVIFVPTNWQHEPGRTRWESRK